MNETFHTAEHSLSGRTRRFCRHWSQRQSLNGYDPQIRLWRMTFGIPPRGMKPDPTALRFVYLSRLETRTKEFSMHASVRESSRSESNEIAGQPQGLTSHRVSFDACVWACIIRPERTWTMPVLSEAGRNPCGGSDRYWRANRSYKMGIGAKD